MESSISSSTRPGWLRQARGVTVGVGKGVGTASAVGEIVKGRCARVGVGRFDGEQAESPVSSVSRNEISFVA